jgi:hypothetical protein
MNKLAIDILNSVAQECDERIKNGQLSNDQRRILAETSKKITEFIEEVVEMDDVKLQ